MVKPILGRLTAGETFQLEPDGGLTSSHTTSPPDPTVVTLLVVLSQASVYGSCEWRGEQAGYGNRERRREKDGRWKKREEGREGWERGKKRERARGVWELESVG